MVDGRSKIQRTGRVTKILEDPVGQFLRGCNSPAGGGIIVQVQDLCELPLAFFLHLHQHRRIVLRFVILALWKIMSSLFPKQLRRYLYSGFLHSEFLGCCETLCRTALNVVVSQGHSDINRFRPWSPMDTGNHLDWAENIPNLLRILTPLTILFRFQAFRDPRRGELPRVQIFMNYEPNPIT